MENLPPAQLGQLLPPTSQKTWLFVSGVFLVIVILAGAAWVWHRKPNLAQVSPSPSPFASVSVASTPDNFDLYQSIQVGNTLLSYEPSKNQEERTVDLSITRNGIKKLLISNISVDCCGGGRPEFKKTTDANIISVLTSSGDMGYWQSNQYFINLRTDSYINFETGTTIDGRSVAVQRGTEPMQKITYTTDGECSDQKRELHILDLTLGGINQKILDKKNLKLECVAGADFSGSGYGISPSVVAKFRGISADLSRIYFSFSVSEEYHLLLDLDQKKITETSFPTGLVVVKELETYANSTYGYQLQYPAIWYLYADKTDDVRIQPEPDQAPDTPPDQVGIPGPESKALEIKVTQVGNITLEQALANRLKDASKYADNITKTSITIGNHSGLKVIINCDGLGCGVPSWFILANGYLFDFGSSLGYNSYDGSDKIFDQILASFKFVK